MFEELPHGDDRGYGRRRIARPWTRHGSAFGIYDLAGQPDGPSSTPPKLRFTAGDPPRARPRVFLPLSAVRRIVSAIRLWRARARSRQELCELSKHMLSDIGLRRVDVGYGLSDTFWPCD